MPKGAYCRVIHYQITQDVPTNNSSVISRYQQTVDMLCQHPTWRRLVLMVKYSEMGTDAELGDSFLADAEEFLLGFKIL